MTRFAGDNAVRLTVPGLKSGRVFSLEARRVRSRAEKVRADAIESWLMESSAVSFTESDYVQLHGFVPFLSREQVQDFAAEAAGFLLLAHRCPDGDPAQARNLELFHQCISDVLAEHAKAAGR